MPCTVTIKSLPSHHHQVEYGTAQCKGSGLCTHSCLHAHTQHLWNTHGMSGTARIPQGRPSQSGTFHHAGGDEQQQGKTIRDSAWCVLKDNSIQASRTTAGTAEYSLNSVHLGDARRAGISGSQGGPVRRERSTPGRGTQHNSTLAGGSICGVS